MNWMLTNALAALLLPPLSLFLLGGAGWLLLKFRHPILGKSAIFVAASSLWLLSTPYLSLQLITLVEKQVRPNPACTPQAIVVLGAGTYFKAPEYGADTVPALALERLRLAAHLHRATHLPILLSGGQPDGGNTPEAELMKTVLENDFRAPVRWTENNSANTRESAAFSQRILLPHGLRSVYLVSQAWHMPRAQESFTQAGFCVTPAATGYRTRNRTTPLSFIPDARALFESQTALHELLGIAWYRLRA